WPADAGGIAPPARPGRLVRMQRLPHADGARQRQTCPSPGAVLGLGLRLVAGSRRPVADSGGRRDLLMTLTVQLFSRARDLAGAVPVKVPVPPGSAVAELRAAVLAACPALRELLPRCAVAVNEDFADDDLGVPLNAEIALLPPVSGGQS